MKNISWSNGKIQRQDREQLLGQDGCVIWLTGLSGSGKSTIARSIEYDLFQNKKLCCVLDGDNLRHGLNSDLSFGPLDRKENIRRVSEVASLLVDSGMIVVAAFISPYITDRLKARDIIGDRFIEVYINTPLVVCEERDPKGLYKKARTGEIVGFTGIDAPYEPPSTPEIVIDTSKKSVKECTDKIMLFL